MAEMGAEEGQRSECGATCDTDLYDLLTVEHVRHYVS